jgi:response regulator RpfG family c-di-GMP phosphodiesterase
VAGLVRVSYAIGPLVTSFVVSYLLTRLPAVRELDNPWRLGLVLTVATMVVVVTHHSLKRLLPLAALLEMSVAFPGDAPSRFAVARDAGNTEKLRDIVLRAQRGEAVIHPRSVDAAREILALVAALRSHDARTRGHSERVRVFTDLVAEQLHLKAEDRERLRWAALLHDVGKIEVPSGILNKPGSLSRPEWVVVRAHPEAGQRLIAPIAGWLGEWVGAVGQHHEKYDGTGYPNGLSGSQISMAGRILAVTDAFEVMTAPRSYRRPMTREKALRELSDCAGTHFDPIVVRAMLAVSVPRLRLAMGPLAWLASGPLAMVTPSATIVVQAGAVVAVAAAPVSLSTTSVFPALAAESAQSIAAPATTSPAGRTTAGAGTRAGSSTGKSSGRSGASPSALPPSAPAAPAPSPSPSSPTEVPTAGPSVDPSTGPTAGPTPAPSPAPTSASPTPDPSPSASSSSGGKGKGGGKKGSPSPTPSPTPSSSSGKGQGKGKGKAGSSTSSPSPSASPALAG